LLFRSLLSTLLLVAVAAGPVAFAATRKTAAKKPVASSKSKTAAKAPAASRTAAKKSSASKKTATSSKRRSSRTTSRARRSGPPRQAAPSPERYMEIQQALASRGFYSGPVDGNWNAECVSGLKRFQEAQSLTPDGKLGALSLIALGLGPNRAANTQVPVPPLQSPD
jgi:peptidoglycan hydrolase-like protein with peptidoglycan-binding domain